MNKYQLEEQDYFYPAHVWRDIGDDIEYRPYKHWGTGVYAGEGLEQRNGDKSGCALSIENFPLKVTTIPIAVEALFYVKRDNHISAVLSFPKGLCWNDEYIWEIYVEWLGDCIERFSGESDMEERIRELLNYEE